MENAVVWQSAFGITENTRLNRITFRMVDPADGRSMLIGLGQEFLQESPQVRVSTGGVA